MVQGWGKLPAGISYGGTHGGIVTDQDGNVYVSTQSETGILVYRPDGVLMKTIAKEYPEVHSMVYAGKARKSTCTPRCRRGRQKRIGSSSR